MLRCRVLASCTVAVVLSMLLSLGGTAAAGVNTEVRVVRHFGDDRYASAVVAAVKMRQEQRSPSSVAVLVAGDRWPEAAASVPLASALGGPLLLTPPDELRTDIAVHLIESGIEHAVVVTSSSELGPIAPAVTERLRDLGIETRVVSGEDRYSTSVAVARHGTDFGLDPSTAVLASGEVFADALSGGQIAVLGPHPVLLSPTDSLPASLSRYLIEAGVEHVVLIGGEAALSRSVENHLHQLGIETRRVSGEDRYQTAEAAASEALGSYLEAGCYVRRAGLARSDVPFDSFAASRLSGVMCMPMLLSAPGGIPESTAVALDRFFADQPNSGDGSAELHVFGGEAAIRPTAIGRFLNRGGIDQRCKPRGAAWEVTAGFPLPSWSADPIGVLRVAMLFMDFPDAPARRTTAAEYGLGARVMEQYLENASYGNLDVEVVARHGWLRADRDHTAYLSDLHSGTGLAYRAGAHAVSLADPDFDFSDMDVVQVVFPSDHFFGGGNAGGSVTVDGNTMRLSRINHRRAPQPGPSDNWGMTAAHEIAHNLGIADLYPYDRALHPIPEVPAGHREIKVEFGLMGLRAHYIAPQRDPSRPVVRNWPNGESMPSSQRSFDAFEMLAWSRFQLGWLRAHHIHCATTLPTEAALHPVARPADGIAMIVLPISDHEVAVVESRRKIGDDEDFVTHDDDSGSATHQRITHEGVLVYTVDTRSRTGTLPIRIAQDSGDGQVKKFPLLVPGESISVSEFEVTVVSDTGSHHLVKIQRAN